MLNRFIALLVFAALAACCISSPAQSLGPINTSTPIPPSLTDWSGLLVFPKFNSSLGTLVQVELDLSNAFTTTLTVTNSSPYYISGAASTELKVTVQDASGNLAGDSFNNPQLDLFSSSFGFTLWPAQGVQSSGLLQSGTDTEYYENPPILSEFAGPGNITLYPSTSTLVWNTDGSGGTTASQVTDASLTGDVIYTYITNGMTPTITAQPASQTNGVGTVASFSVGILGKGPFSYQWQFNGTNLSNNIITTAAGKGTTGYSGDGGAATNASIYQPYGVVCDLVGNLYIADDSNNRIRKVDNSGVITTVAGKSASGYSGDGGAATNASLHLPSGVALDAAGNLFIADVSNNRIRRVDTNGVITTVAGNGTGSFSGDYGAATNATLNKPEGIACDALGDLYIADTLNYRVRRVDTNGIITTVAGKGTSGFSGDGGVATNANLASPYGVAIDAFGNFYIADYQNSRIRKVSTGGIITTVAGKSTSGYNGDGMVATNAGLFLPTDVVIDPAGNLYIADNDNGRVRKVDTNGIITTVAGNGTNGYSGDNVAAVSAKLNHPTGVTFDPAGDLFIADELNQRVREVGFAGSPTLTLSNVSALNAGNYTVVVSSPYGMVTSAPASLTVALPPPTVTYNGNQNTGGTVPVDTNNPYASGSLVTVLGPGDLTQTGYTFASWNTAPDGSGLVYAPNDSFVIFSNTTLYAQWAINSYTLTYSAGGGGTISGPAVQNVNYGSNGSPVTAVPDTGYHFVSWSDGVTTASRADSNVVANVNVTANFAINAYTLSYFAGPNGFISGSTPQIVDYGESGNTVSAVANLGYHFSVWSDGVGSSSRTDGDVMNNIYVTAQFAINTYTLTYLAGLNGTISGVTPQSVTNGFSGSPVTAVPDAGYRFVTWSDGVLAATRMDGAVTSSLTVTASFAANTLLTWSNPGPVVYGNALSSAQLNASANTPGTFVYIPTGGTVLPAGTNGLSVVFTPADTADYNSATGVVSLVVITAPLSVTASNASKLYGQPNPSFGGSVVGLLNGDMIAANYACSATNGSLPGTYPIVPDLIDPNQRLGNYNVTTNPGTLTVSLTPLSITWATPASIIYGSPINGAQLDASANIPGSFAYSPPAGTILNAGSNQLAAVFTPADTTDYVGATNVVSLLVNPAPLSVTASNLTRPYGQANPVLSGLVAGLVNGDIIAASYQTTAAISSPAGMYPIAISLMDNNGRLVNYNVTTNNGTLTIAQAAPRINWTNPVAVVYGTALDSNQLDATADVPGVFAYTPTNNAVLDAGTNWLTVLFTPSDTTNYSTASAQVNLDVSPAALTVTINGAARAYGQTNPIFTGTLSGIVNGDNLAATYNCTAVSISPPGSYPIVPAFLDPGQRLANYDVTTNAAMLTVLAGPAPTFTSIMPDSGVTNAETPVIITGSGFELGAGVSVGGQTSSYVLVVGPTVILADMPGGPLGMTNVVVTNPDGTSAVLTNGFTYTGSPPVILSQPSSQSVLQGDTARFSVNALNAASYQWMFNGVSLMDNGRITGSQGNVLSVTGVQDTDLGVYQLVITNGWGRAVSTAVSLTVIVPPAIVTPPQSQSAGIGGTASFTVGVNGTAPFTYQWLLNGVPLAGATNSILSIANVQTANQGQQYSVEVGNAAGSATSAAATLSVLDYCASAQVNQSIYPMGSVVPLTVQTFDCSTQTPVPNASANVWISTGGTTRSLAATTSGGGSATVDFVPLATEAGTYQVAATLPGQVIAAVQGTFSLVGMSLSQNKIAQVLTPGVSVTNTITLQNLTGIALTGISARVVGSAPDVQVTLNPPEMLAGNASASLIYVLQPASIQAAQDQFYLQLSTDQGTTNLVSVTATVTPLAPQLTATPATLIGTMAQGGQTLINFEVSNTGGATSGPVQVLLPATTWLTTVTPQPIPPLSPGQSNQVTLALTPPASLPLGFYSGNLQLSSSNVNLSVPFSFDCISTLKGSLWVTVQDELSYFPTNLPNVSNATVTVTDYLTGSNVASAVTGAAGTVLFTNLTSAYDTVTASAPDHGSFSSTLLLAANQTNDLTAFLDLDLVDYSWLVTPTVVPDHYTFTLVTTIQSRVPWPVVTVNPGALDLCGLSGQTNSVTLTITNSGLISAQNLNLYFGAHPDWSIEPLVTSLGDLPPQSSLQVPVLITRLSDSTSVPESIAAQLDYQVATPTSTNQTTVPLYVYDANPAECDPQNPTTPPTNNICSSCDTNVSVKPANVPTPSYGYNQDSVVQVKLHLDEGAVIARDGFHATLELVNNAGNTISNLSAVITVFDASNNPANSLFGIPAPTLNGLTAVDGTGVLPAAAAGTIAWTLIPATNAAPEVGTSFTVGGSFSYLFNGQAVTVPLYPVPITVLPTPIFKVDYFLQHDVYSDDPFTPGVEPAVPFALGILVNNIGYGNADNFTLTSASPKIIANANDLQAAFQLVGSQVGANQSASPSFTLDFGNLGPQSTAEGLWYMTATQDGQFVNFNASYQHVDDLGNTNTSLFESVQTHELNHVVEITAPMDDGLPDFLVNDTTNVGALPDVVYSSDGTTDQVASLGIGVCGTAGVPGGNGGNITVQVTGPVPGGWVYLEVVDPSGGNYPIASVQRSDGKNLLVGPNVWQTPQRLDLVPSQPNNLIHIFDDNSTGNYTITYGLPVEAPANSTLAATALTSGSALLNAVVTPQGAATQVYFQWGATTNYGFVTGSTYLSASQYFYNPQDVMLGVGGLQPHTLYHYQSVAVNSAGATYGGDAVLVTLSNSPPVINQVTNLAIADGDSVTITNPVQTVAPPLTFSLGGVVPAGATIDTNGVFAWTPTCAQGSSTNQITILVTDSSSPPLTTAMTFSVIVGECVQVNVGSAVVPVGQTGQVPVTLLSTVGLTNLNFTLVNPYGRFSNWSFASSNSSIGTATLAPSGSSNVSLNINTLAGQTLQSNAVLGSASLTPLPGHSAFLPLVGVNIQGTKQDGTRVGNVMGSPGRIAVIGPQPMIAAGLVSNSIVRLTLYGNLGSNYALLYNTSFAITNWQSIGSVLMTNLQQDYLVNPMYPRIYFQAR